MQHVRVPQPFPFGPHGQFRFGGMGPGGVPGFGLFVLLVIAALVVLVVLMVARRRDRHAMEPAPGSSGALQILDERLARGEIEPEDYRARRSLLTSQT